MDSALGKWEKFPQNSGKYSEYLEKGQFYSKIYLQPKIEILGRDTKPLTFWNGAVLDNKGILVGDFLLSECTFLPVIHVP